MNRRPTEIMSILIDKSTRLLVQGLTGREGTFHAKQAAAYGTTVVGGVTPGKGGTTHEGFPIFDTVEDAVRNTGANTSVIFVPPRFASDAVMEAADAGVALVVCITEEDPLEVEASKFSLNYIRLDGNIGCMVNGAGLAMATMDIIKLAGGEPANFLDVGGGANAEQIKNAFRILMADSNVKAVLINIFGGILRCDVLAQGVIAAVTELGVKVPIVIRMEGTNVEEGKRMLKESGLNFTTADSMGEGAERVVALAG